MTDRRPQRHRRGVNHYSDDNPSTFTIKRKRGEPPPPPPTDSAAKRRAARAEGRRQRELQQLPQLPPHHPNHQKRGPGRPPSTNNHKHSNAPSSRKRARPSKTSSSSSLATQLKTPPVIPPPKDEILSHTVSIHPVLPLNVPERRSFQQRYPLLYQDGRTLPPTTATTSDGGWIRIPEAHKERWVPLLSSNPPQPSSSSNHNNNCNNTNGKGDNHETNNNNNNHQEEEESSLIALPPAPWTSFAVRQDDPLYVCVGDAAGNLLLYHTCPKSVCIQTVRTLASKREAQRKIAWSQSKTPLTAANAHNGIGACTWRGHVCVVWTKQEVEILDVVQHSTLVVLPLDHLVAAPQTSLVPNGSNHNNNNNHATNPAPCNSNNSHNSKRRQQQSFSYQSLDLHSTQSLLLWRPNGCRVAKETETEDTGASLLCVDFSNGAKRKVLVPQPTQTRDVFCHAAVWDVHSQTNEMLTVQSHPQNSEGGENGSSNSSNTNAVASLCRVCVDTGEITQRTTLPESGSVSGRLSTIYTDCVLEQYEDYLFLCTGRGIRCYERNRLTFLTVYGETVALHGTTVGWQACFWIPEPSFDPSELAVSTMASSSSSSSASFKHNKQTCWIQRPDEMQKRDWAEQHQEQHRQLYLQQQQKQQHHHHKEESLSRQESLSSTQSNHNAHHLASEGLSNSFGSHSSNGSTVTKHTANKLFSNMLLVGVPHPTRGPEELQSTLYVWKPGQVLPLTTLQAPRGGLLGLHIHATPTTGWRLTCATAKFGQGWQLSATLKSDFAGTMYPVGYQLLTDNVEYLEDEGELDQVLVLPPQQQQTNDETPSEDSDLQKALKRSLETAGEDRISVLLDVAERELEENRVLVPSVPDPSLCEVFEEGDDSGGRSPGRRFRSAPQTLSLFPSFKDAKGLAQEQQPQDEHHAKGPAAPLPTVSTEPPVETAAKGKGKRSRATNIEAMLQSSIDGALKHKMDGLHKAWNSGGGSRFKQTTESDDPPRNHEVAVPFLLPASSSEAEKQASKLPPKPAPVSVPTDMSVEVTPSEPSPATTVDGNKDPFCAACCDRMVIHTCGKRELPVDTEALERAERARKEAEEAEAKRVRAEKRRIAEAKRRETRRKKKEEEDRRRYMERLEEERRLREEEEQKAQMALMHPEKQRVTLDLVDYSQQPELPAARSAIPKFSELRTNGYATSSGGTSTSAPHGFFSSTSTTGTAATEGYSLSVAAAAAPSSSLYPETTTTTSSAWASSTAEANSGFYNATDPSSDMASPPVATTLTGADGDALAALVGLADSMAPKSNTPPPTTQEVRHYDYSGSSDRRTAILKQLSHFKQFNNNGEPSPAGETQPFHSPNARQMNGGNNSAVSSPTTTYNGEAPTAGGWVAGTSDPNNTTG